MLNSSTGPVAGSHEEGVTPALRAALDQVIRESEEKSLLLSELRHRMKNNLQTVQSLLRLQKSRTLNPSTRSELAHLEMQIAALNGVDGDLLVTESKAVRRPEQLFAKASGEAQGCLRRRLCLDHIPGRFGRR